MNLYRVTEKYMDRLKRIAAYYMHRNLEITLEAIMSCSFIEYEYNQKYTDNELEALTIEITKKIGFYETTEVDCNTVLFFDGFGHDTRGLGLIYVKALLQIGKRVIYLVPEKAWNNQKQFDKETGKYDIKKIYIPEKYNYIQQVRYIEEVYYKYRPGIAFMQALPYDVAAIVSFERMKKTVRYQINLTDHAFWLGTQAFDYCFEFRDYGYKISREFRKIAPFKLLKLPYYPFFDEKQEFEGFSFIDPDYINHRIIFSGGDIYKTISDDLSYYEIINDILATFSDTVFVYAGRKSCEHIENLIKKYPHRAYYVPERKDLFQVMKRICLYINTYPLLGGLMTQYAAMAHKLPITLRHDQESEDILINQNKLGIFFDSKEELLKEVHHLLTDVDYLNAREEKMEGSVIKASRFKEELSNAINYGYTTFQFNDMELNLKRVRDEFKNRFRRERLERCIIRRKNYHLVPFFPAALVTYYIRRLRERP